MFIGISWWVLLVIYALTFVAIAFVFSNIDFGKLLRQERRTQSLGMLIYVIATIAFTFLVGSMLIEMVSIFSSII